jgi:hypothetical protein
MKKPLTWPVRDRPPACPRLFAKGSGPRQCALLECPNHLRYVGERGPLPRAARVRLAVLVEDTCSVDVGERVGRAREQLTLKEIGLILGVSKQAVGDTLKVALRKLRVIDENDD